MMTILKEPKKKKRRKKEPWFSVSEYFCKKEKTEKMAPRYGSVLKRTGSVQILPLYIAWPKLIKKDEGQHEVDTAIQHLIASNSNALMFACLLINLISKLKRSADA